MATITKMIGTINAGETKVMFGFRSMTMDES